MTEHALRRSAPRARVSRGVLTQNLRRARQRGPVGAVDLRRDGWGHGLELFAGVLAEQGGGDILIEPEHHAAARTLELNPVTQPDHVLDPALVLGLPGSGGAPVMSLVAPVLSTKRLRAGEGVSYGYTHRAEHDTRIALVAGGYAEGVVRALGDRVEVGIGTRRHRIVGRVAMDVCVVDIGDAPVAPGEAVVFFGADPVAQGLADWSRATGLLPAELAGVVGLSVEREVTP